MYKYIYICVCVYRCVFVFIDVLLETHINNFAYIDEMSPSSRRILNKVVYAYAVYLSSS